MIASPSDTMEARDAVEEAIHDWNASHAHSRGVVLMPWRWETSAVPEMGAHPQTIINSQGVDSCDIVVALFNGRLGSPTPEAVSGTVAEIQRAQDHGKPVHIYFSTAPVARDADLDQLKGLRDFRGSLGQLGLLGEYGDEADLYKQVLRALDRDVDILPTATMQAASPASAIGFIVQPQQEREIKDYDSKGRPRYTTKRWFDITNTGSQAAEGVTFQAVGENPRLFVLGPSQPTVMPPGQVRRVPYQLMMGESGADVLRVSWQEDGEARYTDVPVG